MTSGFMEDVFRQGLGLPRETERYPTHETAALPEQAYPALAEFIKEIRKARPELTNSQIMTTLVNIENEAKKNLPKELSAAQIDVEVFGRKPNIVQRILAPALEQSGINPASRALGIPQLLPKQAAEQADYMGGVAPIAGRVLGDVPLVMATGGLGKLAGLGKPFLTDLIAGGAYGLGQPLLQGESPTLGGVAGNAAAFGAIGGLARRFIPGMRPRRYAPDEPTIQSSTRPPLAFDAETPRVTPIEAGFETIPGLPPADARMGTGPFGMPPSTLTQPKMLNAASGELQLGDVEGMIGKMMAPKPSDRIDLLRTRRELAEAGFIPSIKPSEVAEEAVLRARAAVDKLGTVRSDLADIAESTAYFNPGRQPRAYATQAEQDAEMIKYFRSGGEHEAITTLHMGFDPFEMVKSAKNAWRHWNTPASPQVLNDMRNNARGTWATKWRIPEVIFNRAGADEASKSFWAKIVAGREPAEFEGIKYRNILQDALKPIIRSSEKLNEWVIASNSKAGYDAATPEIRAIADKVKNEFTDPLYRLGAAGAEAMGREAPGYLEHYFRHSLDRTKTYTFLKEALADATKAGDENKMATLGALMKNFVTHKGRAYLADQELGEAGNQILGQLFKPGPIKETPLGAFESRTANLDTFLTKDPIGIMEGYMASVLRKVHYDPLLKDMSQDIAKMTPDMRDRAISLLRDTLGMKHPSVVKWEGVMEGVGLKLNDLLGGHTDPEYFANLVNIQNISRMARSFEYMRTMYGNPGGAMINLTQLPLMSFPLLSQEHGGARAGKAMVQAMIEAFQPRGHALAREMGAFRTRTAAGLEGQPQLLERMPELLDLFGMTERKINRPISGIAKYILSIEDGLSHEAAVKEGIKFIRRTQFSVDPTTIPEAFRGPAGRAAYQYQSFKQQAVNFFFNTLDKKGKAYFAATLLAVGGPSALPIIGGPLREWLSENVSPELAGGLPGLAGLDLGKRINIMPDFSGGNPQEVAGRTMQQSLGPVVGAGAALATSIYRAAKYGPSMYNGRVNSETALRAIMEPVLRELEPVALQRLAAATEVGREGQLRAGQPSGVKLVLNTMGVPSEAYPARFGGFKKIMPEGTPQGYEYAVAMGLPTIERTLYQRVADKAAELRDINAIQRDRIIEGYLYFKQTGDNAALVEAMQAAPGVNLRELLRSVEQGPQQQLMAQTPRRMRGSLPTIPSFNWNERDPFSSK